MKKLANIIYYLMLALFVLLPLHALLINQLDLAPQLEDLLSGWKEVVVAVMAGLGVVVAWRTPALRKQILHSKLSWAVLAFALMNLAYAAISANTNQAELVGLRTNLIFLLAFGAACIATHWRRSKSLTTMLVAVIVYIAAAVSLLGIVQAFAPTWLYQYVQNHDFNPTQPFLFVQDGGLLRINSSLWGPSQLGSYLVLPICLVLWQGLRQRWWGWTVMGGAMAIALYATHSRGAWLGAGLGILFVLGWHFRRAFSKRLVIMVATVGLVLAISLGWFALKVESPLSRLIFHSRGSLAFSDSSNSDRWKAINEGFQAFSQQPLGAGPGAAGPASTYNNRSLYPESFYLQLLIEVGMVGLVLFAVINLLLGWQLWQSRHLKPLAIPLLAALVGLTVMNIFHHTWTDAATAVIWWGSAGALLGSKP